MVLRTQTGGWFLFFLAAVIPGVHLNYSTSIQPTINSSVELTINSSVGPTINSSVEPTINSSVEPINSSSVQPTEAVTLLPSEAMPPIVVQENSSSIQQISSSVLPIEAYIYHPVLQPSESIPPIATYTLRDRAGIPCIRAKMGVEFIITEKKTWYLSLDPTRVKVTGYCGDYSAALCLTLPDDSASLLFKFCKGKNTFWVKELTAHVTPLPVCPNCANKSYVGLVADDKLFCTATGRSYMCKSENVLKMSSELKVKLVPLQLQAFGLPKGEFGKGVECWADFYKRVVPIIIGAVVVCILLIGVITFLVIRDRRTEGYDRL
ncbi:lysosome-associated membrane glycoprotein 3 [Xyrichtys novacula]|uniref:Lysosome-associated membrane glycoprotein 3 n=1 Tax=Xyrichtys novacula TaxID=13765 RepID=A0AAV1FL24_XYRNO|nr:lysosome-associated membrane glycoprotein 3 [Xyrichtys novacula]